MERLHAASFDQRRDAMARIVALGRRVTSSRLVLAFAGLTFVVLIAVTRSAAILKEATGNWDTNNINLLQDASQKLVDKALPIAIAVAPLVCVGAALAMQFTGSKKGVPAIYCSVGSVAVIVMAKGLMA
jgi:hypothetical protein